MGIRGHGRHGVVQLGLGIHADMRLHAEIPLRV
jgi:hypothetical protein